MTWIAREGGLDPALVAVGIGTLAGLMLVVTGLLVLLILQLARKAREAGALRERAEEEMERRRLAEAERDRAIAAVGRILDTFDGSTPIWTRAPFEPPLGYASRMADGIPVMALVNLKGGVGKTTLAANLAAWFDARGERVLVIDLDHQGSLSAMALGGDPRGRDFVNPGARRLLAGDWPEPIPLPWAETGSELIDAANALQNEEMRLLFRWMTGALADDVRYRLAGQLLSSRVQTLYDRVVIDTPPRITLGFMNALCASTHLLIPTQLNGLSIEAVQSFLATLDALRPRPLPDCQRYRILGVQNTWTTGRLTGPERTAIERIDAMLAGRAEPASLFLRDAMVPQMSAFARAAGQSIALRTEPAVRPEIDRLGRTVGAFAPSFAEEAET